MSRFPAASPRCWCCGPCRALQCGEKTPGAIPLSQQCAPASLKSGMRYPSPAPAAKHSSICRSFYKPFRKQFRFLPAGGSQGVNGVVRVSVSYDYKFHEEFLSCFIQALLYILSYSSNAVFDDGFHAVFFQAGGILLVSICASALSQAASRFLSSAYFSSITMPMRFSGILIRISL